MTLTIKINLNDSLLAEPETQRAELSKVLNRLAMVIDIQEGTFTEKEWKAKDSNGNTVAVATLDDNWARAVYCRNGTRDCEGGCQKCREDSAKTAKAAFLGPRYR